MWINCSLAHAIISRLQLNVVIFIWLCKEGAIHRWVEAHCTSKNGLSNLHFVSFCCCLTSSITCYSCCSLHGFFIVQLRSANRRFSLRHSWWELSDAIKRWWHHIDDPLLGRIQLIDRLLYQSRPLFSRALSARVNRWRLGIDCSSLKLLSKTLTFHRWRHVSVFHWFHIRLAYIVWSTALLSTVLRREHRRQGTWKSGTPSLVFLITEIKVTQSREV